MKISSTLNNSDSVHSINCSGSTWRALKENPLLTVGLWLPLVAYNGNYKPAPRRIHSIGQNTQNANHLSIILSLQSLSISVSVNICQLKPESLNTNVDSCFVERNLIFKAPVLGFVLSHSVVIHSEDQSPPINETRGAQQRPAQTSVDPVHQ